MLSPDARAIAVDLLRPPPGHHLDLAVLTTYSLDLEALLALPLAVLAHQDGGIDELLAEPLHLLEALRRAGERVHVFVDHGAIAIPRTARPLYAMLEASVHPVRAPNGGAFHPKVWVARFLDPDGQMVIRVAVLSRNLTFDRCWDLALASEGRPGKSKLIEQSRALAELIAALPSGAIADPRHPIPGPVIAAVLELGRQVHRVAFRSPDGFEGPITFHALGLKKKSKRPTWQPYENGTSLLAIAPFANRTALDSLAGPVGGPRILVSRQETLDALPDGALQMWDARVLSEAAADEPEDGQTERPSGLHAKAIAVENGWEVTWFAGSANLTAAAFSGRNVEMIASVTGKKGRAGGKTGAGIERFKESGFLDRLCQPYRRRIQTEDPVAVEARARLERLRDQLVAAPLEIVCAETEGSWTWTVAGSLPVSAGLHDVEIALWPISLAEDQAQPLLLPSVWRLPIARLTAFVAFRLSAPGAAVDDVRISLKLPTQGMPEGRVAHILRNLIDTPERFLRFLRALLGGLEGLGRWAAGEESTAEQNGGWGTGLGGETLLEDLVRTASRDPARLAPIQALIEELRATEDGKRIVPDELYAVWRVVLEAIPAPSPEAR